MKKLAIILKKFLDLNFFQNKKLDLIPKIHIIFWIIFQKFIKMYKRQLKNTIKKDLFSGKIIMILWARQTWKTTFVESFLQEKFQENEIITFNWDYSEDRELLSENNLKKLSLYVESKKIIFIDEAQKVENIWNTLKILIDKYKKEKQIIVTGSSSINILDKTSEPLTGRKKVYYMFTLSCQEIYETKDFQFLDENLENFLIYGSYPEVVIQKTKEEKIDILKELANASLYRDILEFQNIRNSSVIMKLLKLLAFQIWSQVSYNELAKTLGIDTKTVEKYIDLLEKSFIIFRLPPFFKNKRKELSKQNKIFFYDLWIRNMLINNFNFLENRDDIWALWENFLIIERMKKNNYEKVLYNSYFWRNYNAQEIDYIEEYGNKIFAFEFKWNKKQLNFPKSFLEDYKNIDTKIINKNNFFEFVL